MVIAFSALRVKYKKWSTRICRPAAAHLAGHRPLAHHTPSKLLFSCFFKYSILFLSVFTHTIPSASNALPLILYLPPKYPSGPSSTLSLLKNFL